MQRGVGDIDAAPAEELADLCQPDAFTKVALDELTLLLAALPSLPTGPLAWRLERDEDL
ncbi:MAG: hypothetical protein ACE5G2_13770 [Candidatus Krumholzibacteriia bacterium]